MVNPKFISIQVTDYPDPAVDTVLALLKVIQDLKVRVDWLENEVGELTPK